jgi:hypothetical protein
MSNGADSNPYNSLETENANQMKEWDKAREILRDYDERLHDLRKFGFSFVTALLTVGAFATNAITSTLTDSAAQGTANATAAQAASSQSSIPELFNLGIFIVTLILIVALHYFDKNYRVFQQAACTRAMVIERKLNLELTEIIKDRYGRGRIIQNILTVYLLFMAGVGILGGCILFPDWNLIYWLSGCTIVAMGFLVFEDTLKLDYKKQGINPLQEDWTISPLECTPQDELRVTLNNLGNVPITIEEGGLIWKIICTDGTPVYTEYADKKSEFRVADNYVWIFKPSDFKDCERKEGVYRLVPRGWEEIPLPISIIVHKTNENNAGGKPKNAVKGVVQPP